jgi:hypothetical protein
VATYFNQTASPSQVALVSNDTNAASVLGTVTTGIPIWSDTSYVDAQAQLPSLAVPYHLTGFTYDMEHYWTSAAEQVDPALSVQIASQLAHGMGLQSWMTSDPGYATAAIEPFAEVSDVILLPGAHQEGSPGDYLNLLMPWITQARAANPNVKLYAKVDFTNGTPEEDLAAL